MRKFLISFSALFLCILLYFLIALPFVSGSRSKSCFAPARTTQTYFNKIECSGVNYSWSDIFINLYDYTYKCIPEGWEEFFNQQKVKDSVKSISDCLDNFKKNQNPFSLGPNIQNVFRIFKEVKPEDIKAVILGEEPLWPVSTGLSFSLDPHINTNNAGVMQRILLEMRNEGINADVMNPDLSSYPARGIFLLNFSLIVGLHNKEAAKDGVAGFYSRVFHQTDLWKPFMDSLFEYLSSSPRVKPSSFILWGFDAQLVAPDISSRHFVIEGAHPSVRNVAHSSKFFCQHYFTKTNEFLKRVGRDPINWDLVSPSKATPVKGAYIYGWDDRRLPMHSVPQKPCPSS